MSQHPEKWEKLYNILFDAYLNKTEVCIDKPDKIYITITHIQRKMGGCNQCNDEYEYFCQICLTQSAEECESEGVLLPCHHMICMDGLKAWYKIHRNFKCNMCGILFGPSQCHFIKIEMSKYCFF